MGLAINNKYIFAGDGSDIAIIDKFSNSILTSYTTQHNIINRFGLVSNYLFYGSTEDVYGDGTLNILDVSQSPVLT